MFDRVGFVAEGTGDESQTRNYYLRAGDLLGQRRLARASENSGPLAVTSMQW